ncbi:UNVERIFIED_ORG: hypothetical protein ABID57_002256 [Arthrobacter sp. UYEF1]
MHATMDPSRNTLPLPLLVGGAALLATVGGALNRRDAAIAAGQPWPRPQAGPVPGNPVPLNTWL